MLSGENYLEENYLEKDKFKENEFKKNNLHENSLQEFKEHDLQDCDYVPKVRYLRHSGMSKMSVFKKQLQNPLVTKISAIECINLSIALIRLVKIHQQDKIAHPKINLENLYIDSVRSKAMFGRGENVFVTAYQELRDLAKVFKSFFINIDIILDWRAHDGFCDLIKIMSKAEINLDNLEQKFIDFRLDWKNYYGGAYLTIVACLQVDDYVDASANRRKSMLTALRGFNQVIFLADKNKIDYDACCLLDSDLRKNGIRVRREIVFYQDDVSAAVEKARKCCVSLMNCLCVILQSDQYKKIFGVRVLEIDFGLDGSQKSVDIYRRRIDIISYNRAPPVECSHYNYIRSLLEAEKNRLERKYVGRDNKFSINRIESIQSVLDDMLEVDYNCNFRLWVDTRLSDLSKKVTKVSGCGLFARSAGKKEIEYISRRNLNSINPWCRGRFGHIT